MEKYSFVIYMFLKIKIKKKQHNNVLIRIFCQFSDFPQ